MNSYRVSEEHLRSVMPKRDEWPSHVHRKLVVPRPKHLTWLPRPTYTVHVGPWQHQGHPSIWWGLCRIVKFRSEPFFGAKVFLNGGGTDNELRFVVHDFRRAGGDAPHGACNSFCRVDQALWDTLPDARGRLGARGLAFPTKRDVLTVMAWCDNKLERILMDAEAGTDNEMGWVVCMGAQRLQGFGNCPVWTPILSDACKYPMISDAERAARAITRLPGMPTFKIRRYADLLAEWDVATDSGT